MLGSDTLNITFVPCCVCYNVEQLLFDINHFYCCDLYCYFTVELQGVCVCVCQDWAHWSFKICNQLTNKKNQTPLK